MTPLRNGPEPSLVRPEHYREHLLSAGVSPESLATAPTVIAAWGPACRALASATGARRRRGWPYNDEWPYFDRAGSLGVVPLPTGAPAATLLLELVACCGTSTIVAVGLACSLEAALTPGSIVVAERALAGDGTSPHYPASVPLAADPALAARIAGALVEADAAPGTGAVWTTDAPFRETATMVATAREGGARLVDMETAALYALGASRGIAVCAVLVVSDVITDRWQPAFGSPAVRHGLQRVVDALATAL